MELRLQLQPICENRLPIQEYFTRLKGISDHLVAIGDRIQERELVMHIQEREFMC